MAETIEIASPQRVTPAKVIIQEAKQGLVRFVGFKNPSRYEYLMPVINGLLTYPQLKECLVKDCERNNIKYETLISNIQLLRNRYAHIHVLEAQLQKLIVAKGHQEYAYEEKFRKILQEEMLKACVGLPVINDSILFAAISLIKNSSMENMALPSQEIKQVSQGQGRYTMQPSRDIHDELGSKEDTREF